jgi:hypothetical protein
MDLLKAVNQISFKKLTAITIILALFISLPISVYVFQKQTRTTGVAKFDKPELITPGKQYGLPSEGQPQITLVWPFLGKVGDAVLIYGQSLGNNPLDKMLWIGNIPVPEQDIKSWQPELIEFHIPQNTQSGLIYINIAGKTSNWNYPFTVYGMNTKTQVTENNKILKVLNGPADGTVEIFFNDNTTLESKDFKNTVLPADKQIISVQVRNKAGEPLPFYVDPAEFGF